MGIVNIGKSCILFILLDILTLTLFMCYHQYDICTNNNAKKLFNVGVFNRKENFLKNSIESNVII